jgi:hypothetical protein
VVGGRLRIRGRERQAGEDQSERQDCEREHHGRSFLAARGRGGFGSGGCSEARFTRAMASKKTGQVWKSAHAQCPVATSRSAGTGFFIGSASQ